ncbi:putative amidase PB8B6.03 [Lasiodiplodia hormozganensis]|uniref:amidase n=1 Tax=Lasiodiplodia hormozganensis TaxID=869390 RepID=A0AA39YL39_9PEZI|nr:putative amidase PB8B6.03 [Lasiodiplodia hormozganensis]
MDWKTIAENKRNSIIDKIPEEWRIPSFPPPEALPDVSGSYIRQYLTSREVDITETDAVGIIHKTTTGEWTAKEVTLAFCHRAALAHQMVSCLHEIFFDNAIKDAERLDAYFEQSRKPVGPLHGLPISLKDSIHVKGVETTMGYVGWIGTFEGGKDSEKYKNVEADVATQLRTLGAILYVKTSVPPASCSAETGNNIIGYTTNPYNRMLTAGGSSGGEGALIALRGSPAGLGTDIGASIRLPSHFNGLYGLKPSYHRLPLRGLATPMDGQDTCVFVVGPMATTSRSTTLLMKSLLCYGAADVLKQLALSGEPMNPVMPPFFHVGAPKILDATEIMKLNKAIREYRADFLDHWNRTAEITAAGQPVDAILMPVFPSAAPRKGNVNWLGYTAIINLLDYASYAIPVCRVDKMIDLHRQSEHVSLGEEDDIVHRDYDPELHHGAPVGLQIVGRRLQEEKVLALGEFISGAMSGIDAQA